MSQGFKTSPTFLNEKSELLIETKQWPMSYLCLGQLWFLFIVVSKGTEWIHAKNLLSPLGGLWMPLVDLKVYYGKKTRTQTHRSTPHAHNSYSSEVNLWKTQRTQLICYFRAKELHFLRAFPKAHDWQEPFPLFLTQRIQTDLFNLCKWFYYQAMQIARFNFKSKHYELIEINSKVSYILRLSGQSEFLMGFMEIYN